MIRVAIITTDTAHHRYFVHGMNRVAGIVGAAVETKKGPRQLTQEAADLSLFGDPPPIGGPQFESIVDAAGFLSGLKPDVLICYGASAPPSIFTIPPLGAVNCHGGKLPIYRGLDTNLWAAMIGRPEDAGVTLHKMSASVDDGPVYGFRPLALPIPLSRMLFETTKLCLAMVTDLINRMNLGAVPMQVHLQRGLVFGAVPSYAYEVADMAVSR